MTQTQEIVISGMRREANGDYVFTDIWPNVTSVDIRVWLREGDDGIVDIFELDGITHQDTLDGVLDGLQARFPNAYIDDALENMEGHPPDWWLAP